jgi:formylglycine-generating enzyme required for sulfatase activity/tRNA A-37 threonylcarbamoyl transferase component Bud32
MCGEPEDDSGCIDRSTERPADPRAAKMYLEGVPTTVVDQTVRSQQESPPEVAIREDGRFRVLHHHADGGIGRVSVALDCELQREVAVKELQEKYADDPLVRQRFLLEVHVTGRLEHPGVVPVYSLGRDGRGRPFYAMRFVQGEDLDRAIKSFHTTDTDPSRDRGKRALALRHLLRRFIDVCNVVAYAHSRGVLHRDLKPANVLLGPYGETLVVDWGMAKVVDDTLRPVDHLGTPAAHQADSAWDTTLQGTVLGTIPYMSPEQARGEPPVPASDVYSLGATLYHVVTGRPPIEKDETDAMIRRARLGEIKPPRQVNAKVSPALEAVCQKAMSAQPAERYPSARALAEEIERWLADEPVAAWKEPWRVRLRRWVLRHRTFVAAASAAMAVAFVTILHLFNDYHVRAVQSRARTDGLLIALGTSEIKEVGEIIRQLHPLRGPVLKRLELMTQPGSAHLANRRRNAALALLEDYPAYADFLIERMVREDVHPHEVAVISQSLLENDQSTALTARLWALATRRKESSRPNLGAAGALAAFSPDDSQWVGLAESVALELVSKNPSSIGDWREVFQPAQWALVPPLRKIFGDATRPRERALAFNLLFDFATHLGKLERDRDLAELIVDANPDEFVAIRNALEDPRAAVPVLLAKLDRSEPSDEAAARRRGRAAACLIVLEAPDRAWSLLQSTVAPDLGDRTELIHDLAAYGVAAADVFARFRVETDASARRALILALGEFSPAAVSDSVRRAAQDLFLGRYVADPDPGTHSAIDWLFRTKWDLGENLDSLDDSLKGKIAPSERNWWVNSDGVTMALVPMTQAVEFTIGSPGDEDGRESDEQMHTVRLSHSYAIATREVSVAQFERFLKPGVSSAQKASGNPGTFSAHCPVIGVEWPAAAAYCNWLSRRENLAPYYSIRANVISVPDRNGLGYRLPLEPEWEYACRAGTRSARPFGGSAAFLDKYAWFLLNAGKHTHPVGSQKPNDLGLFDMLGNAFEWTGDRYTRDFTVASPGSAVTGPGPEAVSKEVELVLRGGSFTSPATSLRSAYRENSPPSAPLETYGFRYVRTVR